MTTELQAAKAAWATHLSKHVARGYYANIYTARNYFARHVAPLWSQALGVDELELVQDIGINDTMLLLLHLFGKGVAHAHLPKSAPRFTEWPAMLDDSGAVRRFRVIPKGDIAKVVGKSRAAVEHAIRRFRRKQDRPGERLYEAKCASVLSLEVGIAIDGIFTRQTSFAYMLEDYQRGYIVAQTQGRATLDTYVDQKNWCSEGMGVDRDGVAALAALAHQTVNEVQAGIFVPKASGQ